MTPGMVKMNRTRSTKDFTNKERHVNFFGERGGVGVIGEPGRGFASSSESQGGSVRSLESWRGVGVIGEPGGGGGGLA